MDEHLTKAQDCAQFAVDDLRQALAGADPVAGIVLLSLIERAVSLTLSIRTLLEASQEAKHG